VPGVRAEVARAGSGLTISRPNVPETREAYRSRRGQPCSVSRRSSSNGKPSKAGTERIRLREAGTDAYRIRPGEFPKRGSAWMTDVVSMPNGRSRDRTVNIRQSDPSTARLPFFELTAVPAARGRLRMGLAKARTASRPFRGPPAVRSVRLQPTNRQRFVDWHCERPERKRRAGNATLKDGTDDSRSRRRLTFQSLEALSRGYQDWKV
jgi:hypothetical protein